MNFYIMSMEQVRTKCYLIVVHPCDSSTTISCSNVNNNNSSRLYLIVVHPCGSSSIVSCRNINNNNNNTVVVT